MLCNCFPIVTFPILTKLAPTLASASTKEFKKLVEFSLNERRKSGAPPCGDFVDRMINTLDQLNTEEYKKLNIKEDTVYASAIANFFGGYDTLNNAIVFLAYYLSQQPHLQDRLLEEIDNFFEKHEEVSYESISDLPYLTACIEEVLRLIPTSRIAERVCNTDYECEGFRVKKGTAVMVPMWALHRNPEHFPNPEEFDPERFMPGNRENISTYALNLFGFGPRNCIGQRYGMDTLKLCLAKIFKEFRFEARQDTKVQFKPGRLFLVAYNPLYLDIVERK